MLSAHGSPPEVIEAARQSGGTVIDAVCPLVTKVHHELKVRARKGYTVLYVGHQGHEEAVGTMAVAPESVHLIESTEDIDALGDVAGPFALLSQTTLSLDEWQDLREYAEAKFPEIWMPNRSDLCFATTNRQAALRTIAAEADAVVVIGSANSSNTVALTKVAEAVGCPRVLRVNGAFELPDDLQRHRRGHGRRVGTGVTRERGARGPQPHERRHRRVGHRRRRVLPPAARSCARCSRPCRRCWTCRSAPRPRRVSMARPTAASPPPRCCRRRIAKHFGARDAD